MSLVFGTTVATMNDGENEYTFTHGVVAPNFMVHAYKMHESVLTGKRTWSRMNSYVEFEITEYLCKYSNANVRATSLLSFENKEVTFEFASDGGLVQNMYVSTIDFFPLEHPYSKDVAIIKVINTDYLQISRRIRAIPGREWIKSDTGKILRTRGIIL